MSGNATFINKFGTREDAGRQLAKRLAKFAAAGDTVVLGMPRGGVSVGVEIARLLKLPFDVLLMSRITTPGCGKMPLGAITSGGVRVLNGAMIDRLRLSDREVRDAVLKVAVQLARHEKNYRCKRPPIDVADRNVILTDDGTTDFTIICDAIHLLRRQHAEQVVVAVPAACHHSLCDIRLEADDVVTLAEPSNDFPASRWFEDFTTPSSEDIRGIMESLPQHDESLN
jgi:putative phosphoribosyl transferase